MFIKVRYGNDELILCNPQCSVNNLLDSITARCGMKNSNKTLDLSDESGIYLDLRERKRDFKRACNDNFRSILTDNSCRFLCTVMHQDLQ